MTRLLFNKSWINRFDSYASNAERASRRSLCLFFLSSEITFFFQIGCPEQLTLEFNPGRFVLLNSNFFSGNDPQDWSIFKEGPLAGIWT